MKKNNHRLLLCIVAAFQLVLPAGYSAQNVTTWRYDIARTGQNIAETTLTPSNVNARTFGKLRSYQVDGYVYAQPLYLSAVTMSGKVLSVVFVATEHDTVFAFDADRNVQLWKANLIDLAHGAASGAATVSSLEVGTNDLVPEIGITATPVIDPATKTIYVETKSKEAGAFVHRLHALDVTTGNERANSPVIIEATVPGNGSGSVNGMISFQPQWQLSRPGLLLLNGKVYIAFASHGDNGPYHGWVMGYDAQTLQQVGVYNTTPNGSEAGIWESSAGLAADTLISGGRMFVVNGNGDTNSGLPYTDSQNFGNSIERLDLSNGIHVTDQWTPFDTDILSAADADQGSGGIILLPDQTGPHPHELVQVGKNGRIEVLDRDNLGGFDRAQNHIVQEIDGQIGGLWSTPAYWNGNLYFWARADALKQFSVQSGLLSGVPIAQTPFQSGFPGSSPVVTSNGTTNGIVWSLRTDGYWNGDPALLYACDATDVSKLLYISNQNAARDSAGIGVKFTVPMVVDGKVFVGTQRQVDVYGLLSTAPQAVSAVTFSPAPGTYKSAPTVTLADPQPGAVIFYTTDGTTPTTASPRYRGPFKVAASTVVQAFAVAAGLEDSSVVTGNYLIGAKPDVDYANGFSSVGGLTLNGSAINADDSRLQLTTGGYSQTGSAFADRPVNIQSFSTDFTFQLSGGRPLADGFTFTIQNNDPHALGQGGGGLGYGGPGSGFPGIPNSIAVKFDLWNNEGEGSDSTGLYVNGASPTMPAVDLTYTGIDLSSNDTMTAHIVYDGHILALTLVDPVALVQYSTKFSVDIPSAIGSNTAYVGFTAATGGFTASQKILTWAFWSDPDFGLPAPVPAPSFNPAPGTYAAPQLVTITDAVHGATIHYTLDGTTPTSSSPIFNGPVLISNTAMLQAIATVVGYPDSNVVKGRFTIPVATPPSIPPATPIFLGSGGSGALVPVTSDFNGDGKADLAIINLANSSVSVMLGTGDGGFKPAVNYFVGGAPADLAVGDFNGDGKPDLAVIDSQNGTVTLLLNNGSGVFPSAVFSTLSVGTAPAHIATGDFNNDGILDFAVTNADTGTVRVLLGTGNGGFQTATTYAAGLAFSGVSVADFNGDGNSDLIVWSAKTNKANVLLNDGTGAFRSSIAYWIGNTPSSVAVGDFNGDGYPDLAVASLADHTVSVLLNNTFGQLSAPAIYTTGRSPISLLAADINGDGVLDLAVSNSGDATMGVLVGKGDGTFLQQLAIGLDMAPFIALAADFNGDGMTDLAITDYAPSPTSQVGHVPTIRSSALARRVNLVTVLLQAP